MLDQDVAGSVAAWLATYLVHGVVLFALAWCAARVVASARVREQLWRAALFGPLLTASAQLGAGLDPAFGTWSLGGEAEAIAQDAEPEVVAGGPVGIPAGRIVRVAPLHTEADVPATAPIEPPLRHARDRWDFSASLLVALGIAVLMGSAALEAMRIHRLGRGRPAHDPALLATVDELRERSGIQRRVRVEITDKSASAYATGVLRPRIVLPSRALRSLDRPSLRAMIAHELGHVARFDPAWSGAVRSVSALFFFQPLNRVIAQRLDECAEFCCDEFAVDRTGDEVALARCLATVAEWIVGPEAKKARPACAMAHAGSPLTERVQRILATEGRASTPSALPKWLGGIAVGLTAFAAPGFAIDAKAEPAPEAVEAPTLSVAVHTDPSTAFVEVFAHLAETTGAMRAEVELLLKGAEERDLGAPTKERLFVMRGRLLRLEQFARALETMARSRKAER